MNDAAEVKHAAGIAIDRIAHLTRGQGEGVAELGKELIHSLVRPEEFPVFCISFSEARDLLSQWRAYSSESGVALCFSPAAIQKIGAHSSFRLLKCAYTAEEQYPIADRFIAQAIGHYRREAATDSPDVARQASIEKFIRKFPIWGALLKHPAFSEEREWRLVSDVRTYDDAKMRFRAGATCIVPYVEAPLEVPYSEPNDGRTRLGFYDVLLGPTAATDLQWKSVMHALISKNIYFTQITPSGAPYRRL